MCDSPAYPPHLDCRAAHDRLVFVEQRIIGGGKFMADPHETARVVAVVLTAVRLIQQNGPPEGASSRKAYIREYQLMLALLQDPDASDP